jgi:hypothetical protein
MQSERDGDRGVVVFQVSHLSEFTVTAAHKLFTNHKSRLVDGVNPSISVNPNKLDHLGRGEILRHFFLPPHPHMFSEPIQGVVDSAVKQGRLWRVKFQGSYWFARLYQPNQAVTMQPGQSVKVMAIEGITLLVAPAQVG